MDRHFDRCSGLTANRWGVAAIAAILAAFLALAVCQKFFKNDRNACFVPYILLQLSAVACSIVEAIRGSKWWLSVSLIAVALAVQAFGALVVE